MKSIGFVPARCGSKEIPMKNVKYFCGKPLIYWTLKALGDCPNIDEVVLATDCDQIENVCQQLDIDNLIVYRRTEASASDKAQTEQVMLEYIHAHSLAEDDMLVLLQATSPFTTTHDVSQAINLIKEKGSDSLLSCARTHNFYWSEDGKPINYDFTIRPMRQDFQGTLQENGAIYISYIRQILQSQNRLGGQISIYEMPEYTSLELDKPYDWTIAEAIMKNYILGNS